MYCSKCGNVIEDGCEFCSKCSDNQRTSSMQNDYTKYPHIFRDTARNALKDNWMIAILTGLIASLIGATTRGVGSSSFSYRKNKSINLYKLNADQFRIITTVLGVVVIVVVIGAIINLIIGGAGKLGYAKFNLNLIDKKGAKFEDLFSQFNRLGDGFILNILIKIYVFFWTLLFVFPGIVKSYSYAMSPYILYEHPEYEANHAITVSRKMMDGNKFNLFLLDLSFIGWHLLCLIPTFFAIFFLLNGSFICLPLVVLTFIGELFILPYQEAARAAFYRDLSGIKVVEEQMVN